MHDSELHFIPETAFLSIAYFIVVCKTDRGSGC